MNNNIDAFIDSLVPRGGDTPVSIYVSLEEYLSRLSNFNRKLSGTKYRLQTWKQLSKEHKTDFDRRVISEDHLKAIKNSTLKINSFSYTLRNVKLENEFEMLLYSITSTLSSLTRVVGCFLKGSTQIHSHSKLSDNLVNRPGFESLSKIVSEAYNLWSKELTDRRDASTHYIALSVTSSIEHTKTESQTLVKTVAQFKIPKKVTKYYSLWEDELPTIGGSSHSKMQAADGSEINILEDSNKNVIVKRERPLDKRPEFIDGEKYIDDLSNNFSEYLKSILSLLITKL